MEIAERAAEVSPVVDVPGLGCQVLASRSLLLPPGALPQAYGLGREALASLVVARAGHRVVLDNTPCRNTCPVGCALEGGRGRLRPRGKIVVGEAGPVLTSLTSGTTQIVGQLRPRIVVREIQRLLRPSHD